MAQLLRCLLRKQEAVGSNPTHFSHFRKTTTGIATHFFHPWIFDVFFSEMRVNTRDNHCPSLNHSRLFVEISLLRIEEKFHISGSVLT